MASIWPRNPAHGSRAPHDCRTLVRLRRGPACGVRAGTGKTRRPGECFELRTDATMVLLGALLGHFGGKKALFEFELIIADAPYQKMNGNYRDKILILQKQIFCIRINIGKDTIFNGIFESTKLAKNEELFAESGLCGTSRFHVNQVFLTIVATPTARAVPLIGFSLR
jgi:hypothetical protein